MRFSKKPDSSQQWKTDRIGKPLEQNPCENIDVR